MNFLNLLTPKEKIVGIEIGNRKLRMLALQKDAFDKISVQGKSEVDLEEGVIENGAVKDGKKLSEALAALKKTFKPEKALSPFAIVTVSQKSVYGDILEFPKNLTNEQLIEAIGFNVAKSSPLPLSECYFDWHLIERGKTKDKVLVYIIPKEIVNAYKSALDENGFSLVALEPSSLSIGRAANITNEPVLFFYLTEEGLTSIIYSGNNSYLSQFEFWQEATGGAPIADAVGLGKLLKIKIKSLSHYFENQFGGEKIKKVLLMSEGFDAKEIIKIIDYKGIAIEKAQSIIPAIDNYDWIPVGGAAKRAFIPRSEDTIISLLPVGTESLYEMQKMVSFAKSVLIVSATVTLFYIATFAISWSFISYLGNDLARQMEIRNKLPLPADYSTIDQETKEFNSYISDLKSISSRTDTDHGVIMEKINSLNSTGITLTSVNFNNTSGAIVISGISLARENLNTFKFQLNNSPFFNGIKVTVQNIAQKNNIPFSVSLNLK